jgi:cell division protein FtsW (lipid II flippase)
VTVISRLFLHPLTVQNTTTTSVAANGDEAGGLTAAVVLLAFGGTISHQMRMATCCKVRSVCVLGVIYFVHHSISNILSSSEMDD